MCSHMIGVAGQGLGLLAFPRQRSGGREPSITRTNALSVQSVTDPQGKAEVIAIDSFSLFCSVLYHRRSSKEHMPLQYHGTASLGIFNVSFGKMVHAVLKPSKCFELYANSSRPACSQ